MSNNISTMELQQFFNRVVEVQKETGTFYFDSREEVLDIIKDLFPDTYAEIITARNAALTKQGWFGIDHLVRTDSGSIYRGPVVPIRFPETDLGVVVEVARDNEGHIAAMQRLPVEPLAPVEVGGINRYETALNALRLAAAKELGLGSTIRDAISLARQVQAEQVVEEPDAYYVDEGGILRAR